MIVLALIWMEWLALALVAAFIFWWYVFRRHE